MAWGYGPSSSSGTEWSTSNWQGKGVWPDQPLWNVGGKGYCDSGKGSWEQDRGWKGKGGSGGKGVVINIGDSLLQSMYRPPGPPDCQPAHTSAPFGPIAAPHPIAALPVSDGQSPKAKLKRSSGSSRRCPSTSSSPTSQSSSVEQPSRRRRSHTPRSNERLQKAKKQKNSINQKP